jgi:hypothetical protein
MFVPQPSKIRFPLQAKSYLLLGFYSSATGLSGRFTEDFFFGAYRAFGASRSTSPSGFGAGNRAGKAPQT